MIRYATLISMLLLLSFSYSCSVSIEGAPCDPQKNNCPDGQYCSSEGICRRGTAELKDTFNISDSESLEDIKGDVRGTDAIISDISSDIQDIVDAGCKDECTKDECKDGTILRVCKDWNNDGCKEFKEIGCGSGALCQDGICMCGDQYKDCNDDMSDGCETNIYNSREHCGSCTNNCGNNTICNNKTCECLDGFLNCNGKWSDGCEISIANDINNCGGCNSKCGKNMDCINKSCVCKTGFANCDNDNMVVGCETNLYDKTTCGKDCNSILNCNSDAFCDSGTCKCNSGFGNCNGLWSDGCEVNLLNNLNHCGECNKACNLLNVYTPFCKNGLCDYDKCKEFYIDQDQDRKNGCEYWSNFPKRYDGNYNEMPDVVFRTADGYLIAGKNESLNILWVIKVDNYGNIIMAKDIQLKGKAILKTGIPFIDPAGGGIYGYLLGGTLENGERVDIFIIKIDLDGNIDFVKNYFVPNKVDKYDIRRIIQIPQENVFGLLGSFNNNPLYMLIDNYGNPKLAIFYQEEDSNQFSSGSFNDAIDDNKGGLIFITGTLKRAVLNNNGVIIALIDGSNGDLNKINLITVPVINLSGNSISSTILSAGDDVSLAISGTIAENYVSDGLLIVYNFTQEKVLSLQKISVDSGRLIFNKLRKIVYQGDQFYLLGADFRETSTNQNDEVLVLLDKNMAIFDNIAIGRDKDEIFADFAVDSTGILTVSSTQSLGISKDIMAVKLGKDLSIENAMCESGFVKSIKLSGQSLVTYDVTSIGISEIKIDNVTSQDPLSVIQESKMKAFNICNSPE